MTSFLNRLKSNAGGVNGAAGGQTTKKAQSSTPLSPLEVLVAATGVAKGDGSDKFFGMHNPSNTCYFNSVVQCLYYSEPFREQMVTFPVRTPRDRISISSPAPPKQTIASSAVTADAETAQRINEHFGLAPVRRPANQTPTSPTSGPRPEDNKDSFEYKKKQAITNGPFYVLEGSNFGDYGMPESLFTGLKDLFEAMIAHDARIGIISPAKFLEVLRSNFELFRSPQHQDAHEFLNLLLNQVVEQVEAYSKKSRQSIESAGGSKETGDLARSSHEVVPKTNTSWVHDIFEGTLTSETRCLTCENVSQRDEVFLDLSVDLEENTSVTACLRKFSEEEMLCEKNKFHCDKCGGLQEAEKRMKIKRLPRILALHLKRFKYVEELGRLLKLFHRVVFPFYLRLLNTTDDAEEPDRLYELYAVIVHLGSTPFHGHYVSIIKTKSGGWLLFDDEFVLPVDKEYIKNYFGGDARNPACAYVLFYQQTTEEAAFQDQDPEDMPPDEVLTTTANDAEALGIKVDDTASPLLSPLSHIKTPVADAEETFMSLNGGIPVGYAPRASEEDHLHSTNGHQKSSLDLADVSDTTDVKTPGGTEKASRGFSALKNGSLKLRAPSMSLRQKPKLWGKFEKPESNDNLDSPVAQEDSGMPKESERTPRILPERQESKLKLNRFSLARKKSSYVQQ